MTVRMVAAAALLAAALPAHAVPTRATGTPAPLAETRATISRGLDAARSGDCAGSLALLDPLLVGLAAGDERNVAQLARMPCLATLGRGADLAAAQRELAGALPRNPSVRAMGVIAAAITGAYDQAAERLTAIAVDDDDAALALIPADVWRGIAQKLTQDGKVALRDSTALALARADWQPADQPQVREMLAQSAIGTLLAQGETSEAGLLLPRITIPELLVEMATERAYAPLWREVEARMGPAQGEAVDRYAQARLDAFARQPDDAETLRDATRAFGLLGRYEEAHEIAAPVRVADGMDETAVLIVGYDGQVLQAAGKPDAALARLRPFATIDPARTPAAVSGMIALAETLDETGHAQEALTVARTAQIKGREALSPWGRGWLMRTEVCALTTLRQTAEARAAGDRVKAQSGDNPAAAIEGLLCAGRTGDAAVIAVATLGTVEGADRIADQFQPNGAVWLSGNSRLRGLWATLLTRADVRAAFEKRARILPRAFWPSRTPRPIPTGGASGDGDVSTST
ncbi:MAG: hypothetical protein ABW173_12725 [Sphingomonas sp.]